MNIKPTPVQMKALIIDDEIDICFLLSCFLISKKVDTDYVTSLAEAIVAIEKFKPEIVFLDNRLPDGRGVDFAGYVKKAIPGVQVAMITAYDTPADKKFALSNGIDFFLGKPFTKEKIYKTLDEMISRHN